LAIYCLAMLMTAPAFSLDPAKRIDQYTMEGWPPSALGAKTVFCILQTRDGYLWLGSNGGLLRFDGFRFVLFEPANTPAFAAIEVRALLETADGSLWIGIYGGGVVRLRGGQFEQFGEQHGLPSLLVRALADGGDGSVWVGIHGGGVARLKDGVVVERITQADGLPSGDVRSLIFSRRGDLWIGTERGGLSRRRAGGLKSWTAAEGLAGDTVMALKEDAGGDLWIATTRALQRFEIAGESLKTYGLADGLPSDYVFSVGQDRHDNLWVGTGGGGLSRFAGGRFANLAADGGLPNDYVWAFYEDRAGSLWVGTEGGLIRLRDSPFTMWGARQGLPADQVHGLLEDRTGAIWIAGAKGLSRFEDGRVTAIFGTADGLPSNVTRSLLEARDGALWVSTDGDGVARLTAGGATIYTEKDGLGDNLVWSLAEDREGTIWAGTQNRGVSRFAGGKWSVLSQEEGLGADCVRVLLADRDGDVWAGTLGGGLSRLRGNRVVKTYSRRDGLGGDSILSLYQDSDGHLWVGTQSNGLSLFANERFTSFDRRRGFFTDGIGSIVGDDQGNLWFSAKSGPFRVARRELLDLFEKGAAGRADELGAIGLGKSGGLLGAVGTGFTPAVWKTRDGRLLYPTSKGMGVVDPRKVPGPPQPPPPILESLLANHQEVALSPPPVLPAGTFALDIHYTAPSLDAPERTRFRYRLEGYDRDWTEVGERRVAYYPNLPPGRYVFRVAAGDVSGSWGESAALPVVLLPYFYQTWWFKALLAALGAWALYGLYRLRAGRLETRAAVAEERNRLAREIHDTLAQDLAAILSYARQGLGSTEDPERAAPIFEDIAALATGSLAEARRSLQALRPPALDGKSLAQALAEVARSLAAGKEAEIEVRADLAPEPPAAAAAELLRIAKEAIGNALRHGGARQIVVELVEEGAELVLRVRDDGAGFDPLAPAVGYGLLGMRERAAALGGRLAIDSAAGAGALIEARIPLTPEAPFPAAEGAG
jgi:ligand-binding sensor domain-containing protein/two-component sensor histidine kinase